MANIDSLNNLISEENDAIARQEIEKYFDEMEITEQDKKRRIGFATDLEKGFRNLFFLMLGAELLGEDISLKSNEYSDFAYRHYTEAMIRYDYSKEGEAQKLGYIEQYAKNRCKEIVDTAILHRADAYYTSMEHSISIGEDEANAVANYQTEQMAISQGYTMKTWVTMRDNKVRHSHELVDGKTIGIFQPFHVGDALMMFPCDSSQGASMKEIANCRCVCQYSGRKK